MILVTLALDQLTNQKTRRNLRFPIKNLLILSCDSLKSYSKIVIMWNYRLFLLYKDSNRYDLLNKPNKISTHNVYLLIQCQRGIHLPISLVNRKRF